MSERAFIFDLDGTLLDTEILWIKVLIKFISDMGYEISFEDGVKLVYGRAWTDIYKDMVSQYKIDKGFEEISLITEKLVDELREKEDVRIKGSIELLRRLSKTHKCCIVSGSRRKCVLDSVDYMDVKDCLEFVLGAEDYPYGKPSPSGFLKGAEMLGVKPEDCVVFEDSAAGVAAAKSAGMKCVALCQPCHPRQKIDAADLILDDLSKFTLESV